MVQDFLPPSQNGGSSLRSLTGLTNVYILPLIVTLARTAMAFAQMPGQLDRRRQTMRLQKILHGLDVAAVPARKQELPMQIVILAAGISGMTNLLC